MSASISKRISCCPLGIQENLDIGRYLVATRDIRPLEVSFSFCKLAIFKITYHSFDNKYYSSVSIAGGIENCISSEKDMNANNLNMGIIKM